MAANWSVVAKNFFGMSLIFLNSKCNLDSQGLVVLLTCFTHEGWIVGQLEMQRFWTHALWDSGVTVTFKMNLWGTKLVADLFLGTCLHYGSHCLPSEK